MIDGSQFVCIDLIALLMKFIIFMVEQPFGMGRGGGGGGGGGGEGDPDWSVVQ